MRTRAMVSVGSGSATMRPCHSQRPRLCRPSVSPTREAPSHERETVTQTTLHKNVAHRREKGAAFKADRKSTRLNSSHSQISYAVFCLKKKKKRHIAFHSIAR